DAGFRVQALPADDALVVATADAEPRDERAVVARRKAQQVRVVHHPELAPETVRRQRLAGVRRIDPAAGRRQHVDGFEGECADRCRKQQPGCSENAAMHQRKPFWRLFAAILGSACDASACRRGATGLWAYTAIVPVNSLILQSGIRVAHGFSLDVTDRLTPSAYSLRA